MSRPFVLPAEPAHDGTDLQSIAERLNVRMADDGLRAWYQRDVSALLQAVIELRDEQRQRFRQKEAVQKLREQLEASERARQEAEALYRVRFEELRDHAARLLALLKALP
jgi:hypothetical protein